MAQGGKGLGRFKGKAVFVPYTLPGESISAEITGSKGSALFGRGLRLKAAAADRVAPSCPHFGPGQCWGCQWQHIDYPAQLLLKQDVMADQLSRVGALPDELIDVALRPVQPAARQWAYNHSLSLLRDSQGAWGLRRDDPGIEAISECHLAHPELYELLNELDLNYERARRLTLRRDSDGRLMLIFDIDAEEEPELHTDLAVSVNLVLPDREPISLIGDAHSVFTIAGKSFRVTAGSSIRSNVSGIEQLAAAATQAAQLTEGDRALDLYAGVGVFSAFLAQEAALVTLVESYPPAVTDADANLKGFENVDIVEGQVEAVLRDMVAAGAQYDVALVDPPSAGLGKAVISAISALRVRRVVYVSGDPASLARDCRLLIRAGYKLREIQPIDLAPQTYYMTAVASFER